MLLSAVSVLVVAQSSSEISEGLMNNPVNLLDVIIQIIDNIGITSFLRYHPQASRTVKVKSNPVTTPTHSTDQTTD